MRSARRTCQRRAQDHSNGHRRSRHLIERELGSSVERLLYDSIIAGEIIIEHLTLEDWKRTAELFTRYESLSLGGTDASLMALAERHEQSEIATLDHRHFAVVRPKHVDAFTLLP